LFEYLEIFHNRRRRHSSLGMLTPTEYELHIAAGPAASPHFTNPAPETQGTSEPPGRFTADL
jgi:hypothetical protein